MTLADGQIVVRVALELGPSDPIPLVDDPAWTDLTDRVREYSDQRGRTDVLDKFSAGTARVVLDNGDRMLDPSNAAGLVYAAGGKGLPLCPVQIGMMWGGVEYPKFHGVLGPEAWPGDIAPKGPSGTVTLHVMDALGHSPGLPADLWGVVVSAIHPDWLSRMDDFEFPVLDDESHVDDSLSAGFGSVEGTTGISRAASIGEEQLGLFAPGLLLSGDHTVRFPAASLMPNGDEDKYTALVWWSARDEIPAGEIARVMEMVHPISGIRRWSIYVDGNDGLAYVTTFDAAGTLVDTATITPIIGTRWDVEGDFQIAMAVFDGADDALTVWFGGVSATLSAESLLYESDLILGPSPVDVYFDEMATWQRELDYDSEIAVLLLASAGISLWSGDTFADRLGHWIEATGRTVTVDDSNQWHLPAGLTDSLWGLLRFEEGNFDEPAGRWQVTLPDTLADAFATTTSYGGGVTWATKENYLRARTIHSLTDPTYAAYYAEPVLFTDTDGTLGADEYRHAGVEVTGLRIDRVINQASVEFVYSDAEPPDPETSTPMVSRKRDSASIDRYGLRPETSSSEWADWPLNQTLADQLVERFAQPHQEIEQIHLDPLGSSDNAEALALAEWLITTCELELACEVSYTPAGADPVVITDLNIQQIEFEWTPERWTVDIVAAKS